MNQGNDFVYELKPSQSKKSFQSASEMTDDCISSLMLGAVKASAPMKTMAALETTNAVVRRVLADSVPNLIEMAHEISLYQNKHHYYQVPRLAQQDSFSYKIRYISPFKSFTNIKGKISIYL